MSNLKSLNQYGQSVWLDYIRRDLLTSGGLARLIAEDGVSGLTSNPSIFEKAIGGSGDYDESLRNLVAAGVTDDAALFEKLAIDDIRHAADVFRPVYEATHAGDGYVSLEVPPRLAFDAEKTITEARRLWHAVDRPNLMIKVPGTPAGVGAVRQLIGEGINVNVTLLFSRAAYRAVAAAYIEGLEDRLAKGGDVSRIASVASFFISRIDTAADADIAARLKQTADADQRRLLEGLTGRIAVANAKLAYQDYLELCAGERWRRLAAKRGARPQRLLWASTGTKNPQYSDVLYVEELVGADTVNTMPPATMDAFRDHGRARASVLEGVDAARAIIANAGRAGLSLDAITDRLVGEGVQLFIEADDKLHAAVARKRATIVANRAA
jgi:transaldolase/glucose-6-phosphate isomerase